MSSLEEKEPRKGRSFGDGEVEWVAEGDGEEGGEGSIVYADGRQYNGRWREVVREGYGTMHWTDGRVYEGQWEGGVMQGNGKFWRNAGVYTGDFRNNQAHGEGTMVLENGDAYTGNWFEGKIHGSGTLIQENGDKFTGSFEDGKLEGKGSL